MRGLHRRAVLHKVREIPITQFDSILMLTDHRYDFEALEAVLNSKARYIGMIGSKNRINQTFKELVEQGAPSTSSSRCTRRWGWTSERSRPAEIAVSIMAEVIHARKGGSLQHLRLTGLLEGPRRHIHPRMLHRRRTRAMCKSCEQCPKPQRTLLGDLNQLRAAQWRRASFLPQKGAD